ncbi:MAG: ECF transporter S component [Oscillospiraceae bacterium]|nr:ECF transporter S component [Oscillospiraceae bacterium]
MKRTDKTQPFSDPILRMCMMAFLCAIALVAVYFIHPSIFPAVSFLKYDPADVFIFIGTFLFGPWYGLSMTAVVSLLQGLLINPEDHIVGSLMHFVATGSFVIVCGLIYRQVKPIKTAVIGLAAGVATMTAVMIPWNLLIIPLYMPFVTVSDVLDIMLPYIIPFNLIKAGGNAVLTFILWRSLSVFMSRLTRQS